MIKETSVNIDSARETQDLLSVNKPINIPNVGELQRLLPFEKKYVLYFVFKIYHAVVKEL